MTKFRRYASGDKPRFTASQLNALNEAALAHSQGKSQTLQAERLRQRTGNHFPVANGTEDNLPAFSVLELQRALIEPDTDENAYKSAIQFNGVKPTAESILTFSITQQYLPAGAIDAGAVVSGVSFARITGPTGATLAKVANNAYTLLSDEAGNIPVLYDPGEDTGERIAIVRLSGGSSTCPEVHRFWTNGPTAGTFDVDYTYNGVTETLTFNYNTTATQFETELLTHSEFTSADVLTVDGGPFPNIAIYVTFNGVVAFPTIDDASLTNGTVLMDKFSTAG